MRLEAIRQDWRQRGLSDRVPSSWRMPLARLGLAWSAVFVLTIRDWLAMADQWWNVSTYNHILFIPAIIVWFVYLRRHELAKLTPSAWAPGLVLAGLALFVWLLGTVAGVNTVSQLGAVVALQSCIVALLGPRIVAALLFPLAYVFFLVPFGDELVPALQMVTAEIAIALTHWSGIPAVVDGVFIDTPAGLFEVAEACSGVKFLVAMLALGVLVAHSCFASWPRRIAFLGVALVLPILANGVRAWGTIYIAQSQGIEFAQGFDHVFYGWVFFALVIAVLLGTSWRWFDRDPEDPQISAETLEASPALARLAAFDMTGNRACAALFAIVAAFAAWSAASASVEAPVAPDGFPPNVPGWAVVDSTPEIAWRPRAHGADETRLWRYRNEAGETVDVFLAAYSAQDHLRDASAADEGALPPETAWRWLNPGRSTSEQRADYLLANGNVKRLALTSYRSGDLTTSSASRLKLASMRDRILMRARVTIVLIVSGEGGDAAELEDRLARFDEALGDRSAWMDRAAGLR